MALYGSLDHALHWTFYAWIHHAQTTGRSTISGFITSDRSREVDAQSRRAPPIDLEEGMRGYLAAAQAGANKRTLRSAGLTAIEEACLLVFHFDPRVLRGSTTDREGRRIGAAEQLTELTRDEIHALRQARQIRHEARKLLAAHVVAETGLEWPVALTLADRRRRTDAYMRGRFKLGRVRLKSAQSRAADAINTPLYEAERKAIELFQEKGLM